MLPRRKEEGALRRAETHGEDTGGTNTEQDNPPPPPLAPLPSCGHTRNRALIVEDIREAEPDLQGRGYQTARITHCELMPHLS